MSRSRTGLSTQHLAVFFGRAWQLRFAAVVIAIASSAVITTSIAADSLQLSMLQRADATLGNADARIQIPGSAPIGTDGRNFDHDLRAAVKSAGGKNASVDYIVSGLQTDGGNETAYSVEEFNHPATETDRLDLLNGRWPSRIGEAAVSEAEQTSWPVGSTVRFFNGALQFRVVGVYKDSFNTQDREFVVPSGTWSSLRTLSPAKALRLDESAGRIVRWSGNTNDARVLSTVSTVVKKDVTTSSQRENANGLTVESRAAIESASPAPNVPLTAVMIGGPLIAGLLGGILAGAFTTRIRAVMWTIGVPYAQTRAAANVAVLATGAIASVVGTAAGIAVGFAILPILANVATQELGPVTSVPASLLTIVFAVLGTTAGLLITRRGKPKTSADSAADSRDRTLYRFAGAVLLIAAGIFVGTGTSDVAKLSFAALAIAVAVIIAITPILVSLLRRLSPRSFSSRLAVRKFASEGRTATLTIMTIAILQVLGLSLAILLNSTIAQVNASSESEVAPGQIVFDPELSSQPQVDDARAQFEKAVGVSAPIVEYTADAGSSRQDGATKVVATIDQLQQIIRIPLSPQEVSLLQHGGTVVTKPLNGQTTDYFPAAAPFRGAKFPAAELQGIDPSFHNIDGFMLETTAKAAGLPLVVPKYIYTDVTADQETSAATAAKQLNFNPAWVQVYSAPDEVTAPLRISAITLLVSVVAAIVLLLTSITQAQALRPDLASLRAIGVSSSFLAKVVGMRLAITFLLSTVLALATSTLGVAAAFALANIHNGIAIPVVPVTVMVVSLAAFTALASAIATRRLRNSEWQA